MNLFSELQLVLEKYSQIVNNEVKSEQFKFIEPYSLRQELAALFKDDGKFQLNTMDDPVEALFAILNSFHSYAVNAGSLKYIVEKPCDPYCLSHELFWINIFEQYQCDCGATSELLKYDYNYFLYEVYVKEILGMAHKVKDINTYKGSFFNYLHELNVR